MWHDMWNGTGHGMWPWGIMMGLFWLLVVGIVIFLVVYLARQWGEGPPQTAGGPPGGGEPPEPRRESPREILDRRYAAGEIDREEYEQRKADLESGG